MQIGSSQPAGSLPPIPPLPMMPPSGPPPEYGAPRSARGRRAFRALLAILAIAGATAGLAYYLDRQGVRLSDLTSGAALRARVQAVRAWAFAEAGRARQAIPTAPSARQVAASYSPAKPINETRRVLAVVSNRVQRNNRDLAPPPAAAARTAAATTAAAAAAIAAPAGTRSVSAPPAVVWPALRVSAIMAMPGRRSFVRINGRLLSEGDTTEGATIVAISAQGVTLEFAGERRELWPEH